MNKSTLIVLVLASLILTNTACDTSMTDPANASQLLAPDGIDPRNPNIERTTKTIAFDGIRTIRIDLPVGHVTVQQVANQTAATMKVTEAISRGGLSRETLLQMLTATRISAERSFVDDTRLDLETELSPELTEKDIAFDVNLTIPIGANVEIFVDEGAVDVINLTGNVEITTKKGAVVIDGVKGNVIATTTEKSIDVMDVTGNVEVETTLSPITLSLKPSAGAQISAATLEADISLMIPKKTKTSISLISIEGSVSTDLTGFDLSDIRTANGLFEGKLNGGGGAIEIRTSVGLIDFAGF